jgi:hypothetical protein
MNMIGLNGNLNLPQKFDFQPLKDEYDRFYWNSPSASKVCFSAFKR